MREWDYPYEELFCFIREVREQLKKQGKNKLLERYLDCLLQSWEMDHGRRMSDELDDAYLALRRKCIAIMRDIKLGSDTWFTRLLRDYIDAHPMEYDEATCCAIYCWMLYPIYCEYLCEDVDDPVKQSMYDGLYEELCELVGRRTMRKLVRLFDDCFLVIKARSFVLRAGCDQMMELLASDQLDTGQPLMKLFLDKPELMDYDWIRNYRRGAE
jgi:hypothetical protein